MSRTSNSWLLLSADPLHHSTTPPVILPLPPPPRRRDSFMKQTYRALTCFLIDFWDHTECEPHTNPTTVQELQVT